MVVLHEVDSPGSVQGWKPLSILGMANGMANVNSRTAVKQKALRGSYGKYLFRYRWHTREAYLVNLLCLWGSQRCLSFVRRDSCRWLASTVFECHTAQKGKGNFQVFFSVHFLGNNGKLHETVKHEQRARQNRLQKWSPVSRISSKASSSLHSKSSIATLDPVTRTIAMPLFQMLTIL